MNSIEKRILNYLWYKYRDIKGHDIHKSLGNVENRAEIVSDKIYQLLIAESPCMIARYGSTELSCVVNYLGVTNKSHSSIKYIKGEQPAWWWKEDIMNRMQQWSGFFPPTETALSRFCQIMLEDSKLIDVLGSWVENECYVQHLFNKALVAPLRLLEPFWCDKPWTMALEEKNVVVVHPFANSIMKQYSEKRTLLFENQNILPKFNLRTVQAVQSLGGKAEGFNDWFEALEWMKKEIDKEYYDICLLGCGAYGFPLAAHVKRSGKKAFHLGGALQLLFGIIGNRWTNPYYGVKEWGIPVGSYSNIINEHWIHPCETERPKNAENVEGACYW